MEIKEFRGNFFEIGQQQGKIYKVNGMSADDIKIDKPLYQKQLEIYQRYYPGLLDELRGIADGGQFDEEKLIYRFITTEIFYYKNMFRIDKACTIFGYKTKGRLYVGRNYDFNPISEKIFETYKISNSKRNSFIAVTDMGVDNPITIDEGDFFYNADDTINDKGLFIGLTAAFADEWSYGISCVHMTKLIAETCETVDDAIKVFKKVPLCCPKNFFIADKNGDMVVVEHTSKKYKVLYPKNNVLIQTNHYVDYELAKEDKVLVRLPFHNTFIRYYETLQKIAFEKNKFTFNSIARILRRPGSYNFENFPDVKTIWTLALNMSDRKYQIFWNESGKEKNERLII